MTSPDPPFHVFFFSKKRGLAEKNAVSLLFCAFLRFFGLKKGSVQGRNDTKKAQETKKAQKGGSGMFGQISHPLVVLCCFLSNLRLLCAKCRRAGIIRVGFWQNGFFADFYFWVAGFFRGFSRRIFSPHFVWEKVPRKILQENPRENPPKFIQQKSSDTLLQIGRRAGIIHTLFCSLALSQVSA